VDRDGLTREELSPDDFNAAVVAITSAFGDPTRREIYLVARESDAGVTASEVAERFELHANVARHHLDKLAAGGYLEVQIVRSDHGGAGRPSKRYRHTAKDVGLELPVRRDDLLVALLGRALAMLPHEAAEQMAEEVGQQYGRALAAGMSGGETQRSFRSALHAVADALTAHGFAAHAENTVHGLMIVSETCPFGGAPVQNPVICAVDRGMVRGMLQALYGETTPAHESSRPQGDDVCITAF
jgi:predicted ArsR family transcriptional regulator